jgi:hypothetical protein
MIEGIIASEAYPNLVGTYWNPKQLLPTISNLKK